MDFRTNSDIEERPAKSQKRSLDQDAVSPTDTTGDWKSLASSLLSFIDVKKCMICVDLDYTLWSLSCFEHTSPPYVSVSGPEAMTPSVEYTSRRDCSRKKLALYPETFEILQWCFDSGIPLSICSKSQSVAAAKGILSALNIWKFFKFPQIYNRRKSTHFKQLKECTDLDYNCFLFFDDDLVNVEMSRALGVIGEKVNPELGLTREVFLRGLTSFALRQIQYQCTPVHDSKLSIDGESLGYGKYPIVTVNDSENNSSTNSDCGGFKPIAGLIPRRMSGIHLDHFKQLAPLDISPTSVATPREHVGVVSSEESDLEDSRSDVEGSRSTLPCDHSESDQFLIGF